MTWQDTMMGGASRGCCRAGKQLPRRESWAHLASSRKLFRTTVLTKSTHSCTKLLSDFLFHPTGWRWTRMGISLAQRVWGLRTQLGEVFSDVLSQDSGHGKPLMWSWAGSHDKELQIRALLEVNFEETAQQEWVVPQLTHPALFTCLHPQTNLITELHPREDTGPITHNSTQSRRIIIIMAARACNYWALAVGFPGGLDGKESVCNEGDTVSVPGLGRFPGEENGNPSQYSCLENFMDRGAWQATIHRVSKSLTWLSN